MSNNHHNIQSKFEKKTRWLCCIICICSKHVLSMIHFSWAEQCQAPRTGHSVFSRLGGNKNFPCFLFLGTTPTQCFKIRSSYISQKCYSTVGGLINQSRLDRRLWKRHCAKNHVNFMSDQMETFSHCQVLASSVQTSSWRLQADDRLWQRLRLQCQSPGHNVDIRFCIKSLCAASLLSVLFVVIATIWWVQW